MSHHCKIMCLCISHWIRLTKNHVSEWLYANVHFIHQVIRICLLFGQRIYSGRSQQSADNSRWASKEPAHMLPFHTSYLSISHTAVVLFARETDKLGGWQRRYKEEIGKKSERGEKSNYANVIERVTVTCSALPFIHHHTTPHVRVYTSWL